MPKRADSGQNELEELMDQFDISRTTGWARSEDRGTGGKRQNYSDRDLYSTLNDTIIGRQKKEDKTSYRKARAAAGDSAAVRHALGAGAAADRNRTDSAERGRELFSHALRADEDVDADADADADDDNDNDNEDYEEEDGRSRLGRNPTKPRRWTAEEDAALRAAVKHYNEKNWKKIAEMVPGRKCVLWPPCSLFPVPVHGRCAGHSPAARRAHDSCGSLPRHKCTLTHTHARASQHTATPNVCSGGPRFSCRA